MRVSPTALCQRSDFLVSALAYARAFQRPCATVSSPGGRQRHLLIPLRYDGIAIPLTDGGTGLSYRDAVDAALPRATLAVQGK